MRALSPAQASDATPKINSAIKNFFILTSPLLRNVTQLVLAQSVAYQLGYAP
jgi:hypothetical protein